MRRATDLPIQKPCPLEGDLPGAGAVRHCASCNTDVVDLSLLTAAEAEGVLANPARPRCISYRLDDAGNVIHLSPVPPVAERRRLPLLVGGLLLAACNGSAADPATSAPTPVAEVAAAASSSVPSAVSAPPAISAEPTERRTRGEMAAVPPAASGESGAGCDADRGATAANDDHGQRSGHQPAKKPKKPKPPMLRGLL